eukprot:COSAG01_NODE_45093_length_412_cov_3.063898_2_plen_50_part_01
MAVAAMARSSARGEAELRGRTSLCIIPGYRFRLCDGTIFSCFRFFVFSFF